jgi:uncharacterized membrane protein
MGDYTGTISVEQSGDELFRYLSEVGNLPEYFSRMTSAKPGAGAEVKTTAELPDGQTVTGNAWFRTDDNARRIEWGSEGPSEYSGHLLVTGSGTSSHVEVYLHTTRVADGSPEVQNGIDETLSNIKGLVEKRGAAAPAQS